MRLPRPDATTRYDRRLALPTMAATTIVISMNLDERATTGMTDGVLDRDRSDRFSRLVRRNVTLAGRLSRSRECSPAVLNHVCAATSAEGCM